MIKIIFKTRIKEKIGEYSYKKGLYLHLKYKILCQLSNSYDRIITILWSFL
ncbi:hypothetical protein C8N46_1127 [Kordia periserrulae]|uniref:Uncharacterized protein n=1 Tax=Kordia periserrulae TaxID=701523 RepID=A0A2T6BRL8_9FLAO|nr:hypothetical protein C8N46_1127 [Kordia periserrulae]